MKPVIGITGNYGDKGVELAPGYYRSILAAGGSPVVIPPHEDAAALEALLDTVDALVLSGGADINPLLVGEEPIPQLHGINAERDEAELRLIRRAVEKQIPILGICRGIQMLAVALGGSIYQDLGVQYTEAPLVKHSQDLAREKASHTVWVERNSLLGSIFHMDTDREEDCSAHGLLQVNSFHHQAVRATGPRLRVAARSQDGVIEAVESTEHKSFLGVQWHPECFIAAGDMRMMPLFRWLVDEAESYAEARRLHGRMLTLDSHCDTPMKFGTDEERLVTPQRMRDGLLDASVMVAYLPQGERTPEAHDAAACKADDILAEIERMAALDRDDVSIAYTPDDLYRLKREGRRAIMLGIENGYAIGRDLSKIEYFRRRGVVYMTLCHNGDNDLCDSARCSTCEHGGLSDLGREAIREMNRVGMMVDMSHAAESSFYDAIEASGQPIVCSHSCCRSLCDHPRNLTDAQMRRLAQAGGVMQVTLYHGFLSTAPGASILDAVEHIRHAVDVMGIEHVGIGSDFDGDGGVPGVAHAGELINLTRRLRSHGFSESDLRLLWGENFLRVMRQVQSVYIVGCAKEDRY